MPHTISCRPPGETAFLSIEPLLVTDTCNPAHRLRRTVAEVKYEFTLSQQSDWENRAGFIFPHRHRSGGGHHGPGPTVALWWAVALRSGSLPAEPPRSR